MKIGDYVRTKNGLIGKIINFIDEPTDYYFNCYVTDLLEKWEDKYITEYTDIKSSPNIIDLIEVGDYVNGNKVLNKEENGLLWVFNNDKRDTLYMNKEDIKSIVTKEQFKSMEYKL